MATESGLEGSPLTPAPKRGEDALEATAPLETPEAEERHGARSWLDSELARELREDPHSFSFFQAVRVLERLLPERMSVGRYVDPGDEVARFKVEPFISFPASEIHALDADSEGPVSLSVNFMGLTGPLGLLPLNYTLLAAQHSRAGDRALREFLDIFHHRFVSLFYRAWEKNRFAAAFERDRRDWLTVHLLDLVGIGLASHQHRLPVRDEALIFYTGLLGPQQRSAAALELLLEDYFGVPVEVEQFLGGWYSLASPTQCSLDDGTSSEELGWGAVVGDEIWDQQSRARIRIGPLTRSQYDDFLPTGSAYEPLRSLTRFFAHDSFDFEIQLVLTKDEVPPCVVGAEDEHALPLAWCTWMQTEPFRRDADEAILTI